MQCQDIKTKLDRYLAGDCSSAEAAAISQHLANCPSCRSIAQEWRDLDSLLDLWPDREAPTNLTARVMVSLVGDLQLLRPFRPVGYNTPGKLLGHLIAAAALSLLLFWGAGPWLYGQPVNTAGSRMDKAVVTYTRSTNTALERTTGAAEQLTTNLFTKEWMNR